MIHRSQRISVEQFNKVMEKGKIVHSPLFIGRVLGGQVNTRIGAVAPQKIFKKAVIRNKIRRNIYEAVRSVQEDNVQKVVITGLFVLILAKPTILKASKIEISTDLKNLFVKAGVIR